jgi:TP901 family phage tail tape measure protein
MAEGAKIVGTTADKMTAADKQGEKFREGLTTLGNQAGKVGLVAAAGLGYAVKSAADFNAEMALVRTLSHANASDMDKLSEAALTVGQNIGYSAKAVAQGEEEMIKAGVSVKDILGGGLKGALDLAAAGQTDVATATSIAAPP